MSYYDMDTEDEEPPALATDPDAESGRESWWDLDDWGDE